MKLYTIFAMLCFITACNISDDGPQSVENECTPIVECALDQCGEVSDGCGATIDCGTCGCVDENFNEFCPSRPCETATGCNDQRECVYEAVSCEGSPCECADGDCDDSALRDCRDRNALVCPANFCDPAAKMENGTTVYQNLCVQPEAANCDFSNLCAGGTCAGDACVEAECGLCNLGVWECAPLTTDATCFDIPSPIADIAAINCNSNSPDSTFIFIDHVVGTDENGSGTKGQPFKTLDAAITAAKLRGARGVVIKSGLVQTTTLTVENGISLYGGFSGAPDWKYDGGTFSVDLVTPDALGNLVAVLAQDITDRTVLYRMNIRSGPAAVQRSSSYGIHALNASALVLQEVKIIAGRGSNGTNGVAGSNGTDGLGAGSGGINSRNPGVGGRNAGCPIADGSNGGPGGKRGNFPGIIGVTTVTGIIGGTGGLPQKNGKIGRSPAVAVSAGMNGPGGPHAYNLLTNFYVPTGDGETGTDGGNGAGGSGGGGAGGTSIPFGASYEGAGGGGGGAGGCGGKAGTPGLVGGGSFGVFAINSTGMEIIGSHITSSEAGNGGRGGTGGDGGGTGNVGPGGVFSTTGDRGGTGGEGSAGGPGGSGGGGAGGVSFSIFCEGTKVEPKNSILEHGPSGEGGRSEGIAGEPGESGETLNCEVE